MEALRQANLHHASTAPSASSATGSSAAQMYLQREQREQQSGQRQLPAPVVIAIAETLLQKSQRRLQLALHAPPFASGAACPTSRSSSPPLENNDDEVNQFNDHANATVMRSITSLRTDSPHSNDSFNPIGNYINDREMSGGSGHCSPMTVCSKGVSADGERGGKEPAELSSPLLATDDFPTPSDIPPPENKMGGARYIFFVMTQGSINTDGPERDCEDGIIRTTGMNHSCACGTLVKIEPRSDDHKGDECSNFTFDLHACMGSELSDMEVRTMPPIRSNEFPEADLSLLQLTALCHHVIHVEVSEFIIKEVDPSKMDYTVITGVQIHSFGQKDKVWHLNLEYVYPTSMHVVRNGKRLDIGVTEEDTSLTSPPFFYMTTAANVTFSNLADMKFSQGERLANSDNTRSSGDVSDEDSGHNSPMMLCSDNEDPGGADNVPDDINGYYAHLGGGERTGKEIMRGPSSRKEELTHRLLAPSGAHPGFSYPNIRDSDAPNTVCRKSALAYYLPDIGADCTGMRGGRSGMVYCYGCNVPLGLPSASACLECNALGHFAQDCPTNGGSGTSYGGQRRSCYSIACDVRHHSDAESRGPPWTACNVCGELCDAPQGDM